MGMYDRDYYRDERGGFSLSFPSSVIGRLVLANVALWLADGLLFNQQHLLTSWLAASADDLLHPWLWWRFISYGFAHDPSNISHVLLNMFGLWVFGRDLEQIYGRREFLRLYLALLLVSAVVWSVVNLLLRMPHASVIGASGAVVGMIVLFVLHYPRRTILLMFVLPVPAWVLGVIVVGGDLLDALQRAPGDNVAYGVHLTGAAFAMVYYRFRWNLGEAAGSLRGMLRRGPKLRVYGGDDEAQQPSPSDSPDSGDRSAEEDLSLQVDEILAKIHREGESSLTRRERRILETASREYQKRRQGDRP